MDISIESPRRDVMATFVYPLIALGGLVVLIESLVHDGLERITMQSAMMDICSYCISLIGGFFLASYLLDLIFQKFLHRESNMSLANLFAGYSMGVVFIADMLVILFPNLFIIKWILLVYVCVIVWEGCSILLEVKEEQKMTFMAMASVSIIFSPIIIHKLFVALSNIMG